MLARNTGLPPSEVKALSLGEIEAYGALAKHDSAQQRLAAARGRSRNRGRR